VDLEQFFLTVQDHIQQSRTILGQSPLVPRGEILVGQEQLSQQWDAPNIIVVPKGFRYAPPRHFGKGFNPKPLWSWWQDLEIHCWGDADPSGSSDIFSFSTATELSRQFLVALASAAGGPARVQPGGAEWGQKTDVNRQGRVLILRASFERHVNLDPPIEVPVAGSTTTGIVMSVIGELTSPDDSSTVTEATFTVP
jgi:hypothetical protein